MIRFGLSMPVVQQLPGRARAWEQGAAGTEILAIARAAERLGFSYLSACDHIAIPRSAAGTSGVVWYDAAVTLAFMAAATTRIGLLSHVLVLPYRHPLAVAKAFATLDHLSQGRVILGVGSGHLKAEFRTLGVSYEARGRMSDEFMQAIQAAWENDDAAFSGEFVQFRDVTVAPRPRQQPRPPMWVGGNSRAAVRRAALYGDGWIPWMVTPAAFAALLRHARDVRAASSRTGTFEAVAPLTVTPEQSASDIADTIAAWSTAGATAFHVGLPHHSLEDLLARMAAFAEIAHQARG